MSSNKKPCDVNTLSEAQKLGIFAHYCSMSKGLLSEAFTRESGKTFKTLDNLLGYLGASAARNYQGYKDNLSFKEINFYHDINITKIERFSKVSHSLTDLAMTFSVLAALQRGDGRLLDHSEEEFEVNAANIPDDDLMFSIEPMLDIYEYSQKNLKSCLNGLSLCHRIVAAEVNTTTAANRLLRGHGGERAKWQQRNWESSMRMRPRHITKEGFHRGFGLTSFLNSSYVRFKQTPPSKGQTGLSIHPSNP